MLYCRTVNVLLSANYLLLVPCARELRPTGQGGVALLYCVLAMHSCQLGMRSMLGGVAGTDRACNHCFPPPSSVASSFLSSRASS